MTIVLPPEMAIHANGGAVEELGALLFSLAVGDGEDDLGVLPFPLLQSPREPPPQRLLALVLARQRCSPQVLHDEAVASRRSPATLTTLEMHVQCSVPPENVGRLG